MALHAGTLVALLLNGALELRRPLIVGLAAAPPALAGLTFERTIERRAGTPAAVAAGLSLGALLLLLADRTQQVRRVEEADARDALWLGLAQACALLPGISRSGSTLAVARFRGYRRADAELLSAEVGVPVIAGATLLKGLRLIRRRPPRAVTGPMAAGAGTSFASTLVAARLTRAGRRNRGAAPFAAYRLGLATLMIARRRRAARAVARPR